MSEFQLPEDTAEDRVLAATEFLDPSMSALSNLQIREYQIANHSRL